MVIDIAEPAGDGTRANARSIAFSSGRLQLLVFSAFANAVRLWREELLAYFDKPAANGWCFLETNSEGRDGVD